MMKKMIKKQILFKIDRGKLNEVKTTTRSVLGTVNSLLKDYGLRVSSVRTSSSKRKNKKKVNICINNYILEFIDNLQNFI